MSRIRNIIRAHKGHYFSTRVTTGVSWIDDHYGLNRVKGVFDLMKKKNLLSKLSTPNTYVAATLPDHIPLEIDLDVAIIHFVDKLNKSKLALKHTKFDRARINDDTSYYFEKESYIYLIIYDSKDVEMLRVKYDFRRYKIISASYALKGYPYSVNVIGRQEIDLLAKALKDYSKTFIG